MTGDILTPLALWGGYKIEEVPQAQVIDERKNGDIIISRIYIEGRKTDKGQVQIYGVMAKNEGAKTLPAIFILQDLDSPLDEKVVIEFAKQGFLALAIDLCGQAEGVKRFTKYPEDLSYANYELAKDNLYKVETDVSNTCWYEWCSASRYAVEYLNNLSIVSGIVGLGVKIGAGVLWQTIAFNPVFSAVAFVMNAGWKAHNNIYKFGDRQEPQFNDDVLKYVAGLDPHSYATHCPCPCLMLSATNNPTYDCDRAYDTVSRVNDEFYRAVNYSVSCIDTVDETSFDEIVNFYGSFTKRQGVAKVILPNEPEIKCTITNGELEIDAVVDKKNLSEVCAYVSEERSNPAKRTWIKLTNGQEIKQGKYRFKYNPYGKSQLATLFVKAIYNNGFALCSNIIAKRFAEKDVLPSRKQKIIYSGRVEGGESVFVAVGSEKKTWHETEKSAVTVKRGPMTIDGVTARNGLLTFMPATEKYKPVDDAILMFDLFSKQDCLVTVKLITDYFGDKIEYACSQKVNGGKIWHNIRMEMNRFKTAEGRILKTYEKVTAIEFTADCEFLLNNALWI